MEQPEQQAVYGWNLRTEVMEFIPGHAKRVLEVGCGQGGFALTLRERLGSEAHLVGMDPVATQVRTARAAGFFDEVVEGYFPDDLDSAGSGFDLIVFNDVLEHMVDPWGVLERSHEYLTNAGTILATIPNLRYLPVMVNLVRGEFEYAESGVMDRTHLRFFTREGMLRLFESTGYRVSEQKGVNNVVREHPHLWPGHVRKLRHLFGDMQWMQYVVKAVPK